MPEISVILPVYNSGQYLSKAIESVLQQTFSDLELIIINDGSTDNSAQIIRSFTDPRIRSFDNEGNKGLVYSLNRAIDLATGKYIARMDADDICVKERLAIQKQYLDDHPQTVVVASTVNFINEKDGGAGSWPLDKKTTSFSSIKKVLPYQNCIAHPSVMGRSAIFKRYKYRSYQKNIEDFDLWLRLTSDNQVIEKLPQPLLLYRLHTQSVTHVHLKKNNFFFKHFHCKRRFLAEKIAKGRINGFVLTVFFYMLFDIIMGTAKMMKRILYRNVYRLNLFKRFIEDIIMYPFILLGRLIATIKPLDREYDTFFFFPFYHIGGAEKVHAQVAQALGNSNCIIFFTRKSLNDLFYEEFRKSGCIMKDISRYTDNKWLYFVNLTWRGIATHYINKQKKQPVVFNGQCNFGYKITPWVKKSIPQVELIHSLCSFSYIRIPFMPFITRTVMISTIRIDEHIDLYKRLGIPLSYKDRIQFILNAIPLPEQKPLPENRFNAPLTVLYSGRSTAEKRVHLVTQIAKQAEQEQLPVQFQFMGDVSAAIPPGNYPNCHFWGNQSDPAVINDIYNNAHILILVSDTEGFPMVIMEAMARGLAIVTTAVGEIPLHVRQNENGILIEEYMDEQAVVQQSLAFIKKALQDATLLPAIAEKNIPYAYAHFGIERFNHEYREVISEAKNALV